MARIEAVQRAAELMDELCDTNEVKRRLVSEFGVSRQAAWEWLEAALTEHGELLARSQVPRRAEAKLDLERSIRRLHEIAESALSKGELSIAVAATKAAVDARARWCQTLHLDKISPLLGLDTDELRARLVRAVAAAPHLLTEDEREMLQAVLADAGGEVEGAEALPADWVQ